MLLGAIFQSVPDIDFMGAFFFGLTENLLAHRGITHSLFFLVLATVVIALICRKVFPGKIAWHNWIFFIALEIGVHLLLDASNNYGMGLLEPFSNERMALHIIFVADPLFSIWTVVAVLVLMFLKQGSSKRKTWCITSIALTSLYFIFCARNKLDIESDHSNALQQQGIAYQQKLSTPTPFNNLLWFLAAGGDDGYYIGYRSVFDKTPSIDYRFFPRNDSLLKGWEETETVKDLKRFSQGFYTIEKWGDTLVFNDLRFGQMVGWHDPKERFVFHYLISLPDAENRLVVQRGRFAKWNRETLGSMWTRIKGE